MAIFSKENALRLTDFSFLFWKSDHLLIFKQEMSEKMKKRGHLRRFDFRYTKNSMRPGSDFIYTKNSARPRSDLIYTKNFTAYRLYVGDDVTENRDFRIRKQRLQGSKTF